MSGHNILQQLAREPELEIVDPGNGGTIPVDRTLGICSIVTAASETRKIASPERAGIIIAICFKTDGGDVAITGLGSEILNSGAGTETTATMADAGDLLVLMSINKGAALVWSPVANNGAAMS
jgi:hypothetical protein|tara:strand:+ start:79 stop:447 length:369 start_codon:yes stop_codon:yes gene_type:complete